MWSAVKTASLSVCIYAEGVGGSRGPMYTLICV